MNLTGSPLAASRTASNRRAAVPWGLLPMLAVGFCICAGGCGREPDSKSEEIRVPPQGKPIATSLVTNTPGSNAPAPFVPADYSKPDVVKDGLIHLGWDKLSGFKFDVYEVYSETNAGRALIRSDDTIPLPMKAYDGKAVSVTGFILPLRTKKGLVTEFLLLRDQGTCCFGAQAQINHFMRVRYPRGIAFGDPVPWKLSGTIRVGETYIQGYLTGIYELEAETAVEVK